jgi:hypothetical protein
MLALAGEPSFLYYLGVPLKLFLVENCNASENNNISFSSLFRK